MDKEKFRFYADLEIYFCGRNGKAYFNKKTQKGISNFWRLGTYGSQVEKHKACFPVGLPTKGIELMSSRGDIVLDPMFGVGTTAVACIKTKRNFIGIEQDAKYCEIAQRRLAQEYLFT